MINYFSIKPALIDGACTGATITFTDPVLGGSKDSLSPDETVVEVTDSSVTIISGGFDKESLSHLVPDQKVFLYLADDAIKNCRKTIIGVP
jgi:hypothetical protein